MIFSKDYVGYLARQTVKHLVAEKMIHTEKPVLVNERTATRTLKTWDRIAARIVEQNGKSVLAGGLLAFTVEGSEELFSRLRNGVAGPGTKRRRGTSQAGALKGWRGSEEE